MHFPACQGAEKEATCETMKKYTTPVHAHFPATSPSLESNFKGKRSSKCTIRVLDLSDLNCSAAVWITFYSLIIVLILL